MSAHHDSPPVDASAVTLGSVKKLSSKVPSKQFFGVKFDPDLPVQNQMRVEDEDIPKLYSMIDVDNNGTISYKEMSSFILGRYCVSDNALKRILVKFDKDLNGSYNLEEFAHLMSELNKLLENFDNEEINTLTKYGEASGYNSAFAFFCCPCTCGISVYLSNKSNTKLISDLNEFVASKKSRLDAEVENKLSYHLGATFLELHAPTP